MRHWKPTDDLLNSHGSLDLDPAASELADAADASSDGTHAPSVTSIATANSYVEGSWRQNSDWKRPNCDNWNNLGPSNRYYSFNILPAFDYLNGLNDCRINRDGRRVLWSQRAGLHWGICYGVHSFHTSSNLPKDGVVWP